MTEALLITTGNGAQREVINSIDSFCLSNGAPVRVFNWQNVSFSASSEETANTDRSLLNLTVQTNAADYFENTPAEQSAPDGFYLQFNSDSLAKYTGNGYWTNHTSCLFYKGGGTNGGGYMVELASWQFKTLSWNPAPYNTNFSPNLDIQIVLTTTNWALSILGDVNTNGQPLYFSGAYTNAGINTSTNVGAWDIIGTTNITSDVTNDLENGVGYCIGAENQTEGPGLTMSFGKITVASIANPIVLGPTITTSNELAAFGYNTNTIYSGEALALSAQVSDTSPGANVQYLWQVANEAVPGTFTNLANGTSSNVVINTLPFSDGNNSSPWIFQVVVTDGINPPVTNATPVTILPAQGPQVTQDVPGTAIVLSVGQTLTLPVSLSGNLPMYFQWVFNSQSPYGPFTNLLTQTNNVLKIPNLNTNETGYYQLIASNSVAGGLTAESSVQPITVNPLIPIPPLPGSYGQLVVTNAMNLNLVAFWQLNETSSPAAGGGFTEAIDYSGNGNTATYGAAALNESDGIFGPTNYPGFATNQGALETALNTPSSCVTAPNLNLPATNMNVTISMWIDPLSVEPASSGLFFNRGASANGLGFGNTPGHVGVQLGQHCGEL